PLQNPNFNIAAQPAEVESPMVKSFGITQEDVGVESGAIINGAGFEAQPGLEAERNNGKGDLEMLEPEFKMLLEGMQEEDWLVREDEISGASPAPPPVVPSTLEHHPVSNDGQLPRNSSYPPNVFDTLKQEKVDTSFQEMIEHLLETGMAERAE